MSSPYLELQLRATRGLLKFLEDHNGPVDADLRACLRELEKADVKAAVHHARMIKPHGMGGITDWFPRPIGEFETEEYAGQILLALTN